MAITGNIGQDGALSTMQGKGKKALITGIAGQDGSFLAELLLGRGYEVHGIEHPSARNDPGKRLANINPILEQIRLHFGSLTETDRIRDIVQETTPHECYHLAAESFISYAFEDEAAILETNLHGTHNLLASLKKFAPDCRIFFAGSSEMFGSAESQPQDENTRFRPRSIYGISKVAGHNLINYYREQHGLFACTGFLYNHESPRRGAAFVTRKISMTVAKIKHGVEEKLCLGNLDALRDWGYAPEYVEAMWLMLQQNTPRDFVIATGKLHSVREFADCAFREVGLDYRNHVVVDPLFYRETEKVALLGNPENAHRQLGWKRNTEFEQIVSEMVRHDLGAIESIL